MNSVICRDAMAFENLLGFDPDINIADEDGWTAFMYSVVNATNANDTFIADLISAGANLTVKNRVSLLSQSTLKYA